MLIRGMHITGHLEFFSFSFFFPKKGAKSSMRVSQVLDDILM